MVSEEGLRWRSLRICRSSRTQVLGWVGGALPARCILDSVNHCLVCRENGQGVDSRVWASVGVEVGIFCFGVAAGGLFAAMVAARFSCGWDKPEQVSVTRRTRTDQSHQLTAVDGEVLMRSKKGRAFGKGGLTMKYRMLPNPRPVSSFSPLPSGSGEVRNCSRSSKALLAG